VTVSGTTLTLKGGTYHMNQLTESGSSANVTMANGEANITLVNSLTMSGGSHINIPSDKSASAVINVVTTAGVSAPVNLSGGSLANGSYDPTMFQIQYGGTGTITLSGGSGAAMLIYAPNAPATISGGGNVYGSIVTSTLNNSGGSAIYYDSNLSNVFFTIGNTMMSSFNWQRY
jgi:hypothetical protein